MHQFSACVVKRDIEINVCPLSYISHAYFVDKPCTFSRPSKEVYTYKKNISSVLNMPLCTFLVSLL